MQSRRHHVRRLAGSILALSVASVLMPNAQAVVNPTTLYVTNCNTTNKTAVIATEADGSPLATNLTWSDLQDAVTVENECTTVNFSIQLWSATLQLGAAFDLSPSGTAFVSLPSTSSVVEMRIVGTAFPTPNVFATLPATYTGGSSQRSSAATVAPQPIAAELTLASSGESGASCRQGASVIGYAGQWLTLPAQEDCTLSSGPNAKLLGWSTSADFPVSIAQRQADNGWGTYQLTNEAGEVTAVYIPAGHAAYVSGSNALHPIWSA